MKKIFALATYLLRLVATTWRITTNKPLPPAPAVIAFWHGEMLPVWKLFSNENSYGIVSMNKDGEILAKILKKWNIKLVRGSSSRGGQEVLKKIYDIEDNNAYFLLTPDGPRGPRYECKKGAFIIAQRKQIPLYFVKTDITKKKIFHRSWDKFEFPLPFSNVKLTFSEPLYVDSDVTRDEIIILAQQYSQSN